MNTKANTNRKVQMAHTFSQFQNSSENDAFSRTKGALHKNNILLKLGKLQFLSQKKNRLKCAKAFICKMYGFCHLTKDFISRSMVSCRELGSLRRLVSSDFQCQRQCLHQFKILCISKFTKFLINMPRIYVSNMCYLKCYLVLGVQSSAVCLQSSSFQNKNFVVVIATAFLTFQFSLPWKSFRGQNRRK